MGDARVDGLGIRERGAAVRSGDVLSPHKEEIFTRYAREGLERLVLAPGLEHVGGDHAAVSEEADFVAAVAAPLVARLEAAAEVANHVASADYDLASKMPSAAGEFAFGHGRVNGVRGRRNQTTIDSRKIPLTPTRIIGRGEFFYQDASIPRATKGNRRRLG